MLLRNIDILVNDPVRFVYLMVVVAVALLVGITVHEFGHAFTASFLGDPTARRLGRVSLNPLRHLDPGGTIMIFLVGFGWGKPVPVDFRLLRGDPRRSMAMVSVAGAASNLIVAAILGAVVRLGLIPWQSPRFLPVTPSNFEMFAADVVGFAIFLSLILAVFNMIPIAPLDGFKIVVGVLPERLAYSFARLERRGPLLLLLLLVVGYSTGMLWDVLIRPVDGFMRLFSGQGIL